ncbi:MAG: hypothetical protein ACLUAR_00680 [Pilosibacter sp.]
MVDDTEISWNLKDNGYAGQRRPGKRWLTQANRNGGQDNIAIVLVEPADK